MADMVDHLVLPYNLFPVDETRRLEEQDDDGDTTLVIDESSSPQYPVDLSLRPPPALNIDTSSWSTSVATTNVQVGKSGTGSQLTSSLLSILQQPSSSSNSISSSSELTHQFPSPSSALIPDMVQISSDSGDGQNAGRCRKYRKMRKRVLSECMKELEAVQTKHNRLKARHDRLEYKVETLKSVYIYSILNKTYDCMGPQQSSNCINIAVKQEPSE